MKSAATRGSMIEPLATALEQVLRTQLQAHEKLLECVLAKREAIRAADIATITAMCGRENDLIQRLAGLEKNRLELISQLTRIALPQAKQPFTINEAAEIVAEPQRTRLIGLGAQLRGTLEELRKQSSIVRHAAESLSRHMTGIVQTVHSALSRARVYGSRGKISMSTHMQSVVDIKS